MGKAKAELPQRHEREKGKKGEPSPFEVALDVGL